MNEGEEEFTEDFLLITKRQKSTKEEILDENFNRASRSIIKVNKKTPQKKYFRMLGVVLIVIAFFCLIIVNFSPWMFIKFDAENGTTQEYFFKDFENKNEDYNLLKNLATTNNSAYLIQSIMGYKCSTCSIKSDNYLGLATDDFTDTPRYVSYAFVILMLLGLIFSILEMIDKMLKFSSETSLIIHTTFATAAIFISFFIIVLLMKFFGGNILQLLNAKSIEFFGISNLLIVFITPIIIVFTLILLIKICLAIMKINMFELKKKLKTKEHRSSFSSLRYKGGQL